MNRVTINLQAVAHNLGRIEALMDQHGASFSVVSKALCGHVPTLRALGALGVRSFADSRLDNLRAVARSAPGCERWYLRPPHLSAIPEVVALSDVSLNTEVETVRALSREARRLKRTHKVVVMTELGDLREGVLPEHLPRFLRAVWGLPNIQVIGIGSQLGCMSGAAPTAELMERLLDQRRRLQTMFGRKLPVVSAGSSIFLSLLPQGTIPRGVNHFRIGEALLLGTDLMTGEILPGFRNDAITLEAEVVEIKEKRLVPDGETVGSTPFSHLGADPPAADGPADERGYRALVAMGQLDTEISGLTPQKPGYQIAGASSDITAVNLGSDPGALRVGSTIAFTPSYGAMVRAMNDPYLKKEVRPPLDAFLRAREARRRSRLASQQEVA